MGATFGHRSFEPPSQEGFRTWRSKSTGTVVEAYSPPPPKHAEDWEEIDPPHTWDHEHCEFCWAKFMPQGTMSDPSALTEGYMTEGDHWVCAKCFADFRHEFEWVVADSD